MLGARRSFDPKGSARDNPVTAIITFGEGYHSFHHRFQADYRTGIRWWDYDPAKWTVWVLARLGLARDLRRDLRRSHRRRPLPGPRGI